MSFGWLAGDVVSALNLLYQVSTALRESGGVSSDYQDTISFLGTLTITLEHLNAVQSISLDSGVADNLRDQCDHMNVPSRKFLVNANRRSDSSLSSTCTRKIQWAILTAKEVKKLQDKIAVPMAAIALLLGQQIFRNTSQLPQDIQNGIAWTIDATKLANGKVLEGVSRVESGVQSIFAAFNSYNGVSISSKAWRAAIQPNTKVGMALVTFLLSREGYDRRFIRRCAELSGDVHSEIPVFGHIAKW
ncbi:uncharacterized protein RSE6_04079 [Rhynchosporium secalis]|uniref:Fungal N-terminal domain-containing protein n=1 Tax=Rhynchosporium secalis TaxID=38038 RepID=A0A1E1M4E1_RHYSE|nr:uncharacterized protein RSE6_04079 [Rhynchosporium secalis]